MLIAGLAISRGAAINVNMERICGYRPKLTLSMCSSSLYDIDESIFAIE